MVQRQEGTEAKGEEGEGTGAAGSRLTDLTDGTKDLGGASARGCWQLVQERSSAASAPPVQRSLSTLAVAWNTCRGWAGRVAGHGQMAEKAHPQGAARCWSSYAKQRRTIDDAWVSPRHQHREDTLGLEVWCEEPCRLSALLCVTRKLPSSVRMDMDFARLLTPTQFAADSPACPKLLQWSNTPRQHPMHLISQRSLGGLRKA